VAIARALITRPAVVFADEPTGALDSTSSHQLLDYLRHTSQVFEQTIVMVTHDPNAAALSASLTEARFSRTSRGRAGRCMAADMYPSAV